VHRAAGNQELLERAMRETIGIRVMLLQHTIFGVGKQPAAFMPLIRAAWLTLQICTTGGDVGRARREPSHTGSGNNNGGSLTTDVLISLPSNCNPQVDPLLSRAIYRPCGIDGNRRHTKMCEIKVVCRWWSQRLHDHFRTMRETTRVYVSATLHHLRQLV
jgi:hypothetical protein